MAHETRVADLSDVPNDGSYLFTVEDSDGNEHEVILVPCDAGVEAWVNVCPHESQRFDRGSGAALREGEIICPRHGSMFDACAGDCDNGPASGSSLTPVDVDVADGTVFLTDDDYTYLHGGGIDAADDGPSSTSHLSF
ncbi:Rieske (2Fe-2S) protein [Haloplanus sp. GCM10025708]|uniref:Rieske (2Fe-2S) protein n=1 Tax=Haloferacaceae TaxID=1644056 RepID=UPI003611BF53